jgi:hypothetical protein
MSFHQSALAFLYSAENKQQSSLEGCQRKQSGEGRGMDLKGWACRAGRADHQQRFLF